MTVETCNRCRVVTDTDEDHRCPHGEYCQMLDGNTGDCRSYCHVCDDELRDAEVAALRVELAHQKAINVEVAASLERSRVAGDALRARVSELEAALRNEEHEAAGDEIERLAHIGRLERRVAELEAPRSPSALELAEDYAVAYAAYLTVPSGSPGFRDVIAKRDAIRAALVAYDKRK